MSDPYAQQDNAHDRADNEAEARNKWEEAEAKRLVTEWTLALKNHEWIQDPDLYEEDVMQVALDQQISFDEAILWSVNHYIESANLFGKLSWD